MERTKRGHTPERYRERASSTVLYVRGELDANSRICDFGAVRRHCCSDGPMPRRMHCVVIEAEFTGRKDRENVPSMA